MRLLLAVTAVVAACHPPGWGKDDAVDAAGGDGAIDAVLIVDAAADASAACAKSFRLEGHGGAAATLLTGDFVAWADNVTDGALAMTLGGDGAWTVQQSFEPGLYQYRFVVDGTWMEDPGNPDTVPNGLGGVNSLVRCP